MNKLTRLLGLGLLLMKVLTFSMTSNSQNIPSSGLTGTSQLPEAAEIPGASDPCDDLFAAACLVKDGSDFKFKSKRSEHVEYLVGQVRNAKDLAAKQMGFSSYDDAIKKKLKKVGIEVADQLDKFDLNALRGEVSSSYLGSDNSDRIFPQIGQCSLDRKALGDVNILIRGARNESELKAIKNRYIAFLDKYVSATALNFSSDIVAFSEYHTSERLKSIGTSMSAEDFAKKKKDEIKFDRVINELFRGEKNPAIREKARRFVQQNLILGNRELDSYKVGGGNDPDQLVKDINELSSASYAVCSSYSGSIKAATDKITRELALKTAKAKVTVEYLIDRFYSDDVKNDLQAELAEARISMQTWVGAVVKDEAKKKKILQEYDSLTAVQLKKPAKFVEDEDGLRVLDLSQIMPNDPLYGVFTDPSLSHFYVFNAFYEPEKSLGKIKTEESIKVLPFYASLVKKNPISLFALLSHEMGHKIGPVTGALNLHDISSVFKDLLNCYRQTDSINMNSLQHEEFISEYLSSESTALKVQKLPVGLRKKAVVASLEHLCWAAAAQGPVSSNTNRSTHPEISLRINGIVASNPSIRRVMGCRPGSQAKGVLGNFRVCGLKTSILDVPGASSVLPAPVKIDADKSKKNGVKQVN